MAMLVHIENGEPAGWITGANMDDLFQKARERLAYGHPALDALYSIKDMIELGIDTQEKRQIYPGHWLLLD